MAPELVYGIEEEEDRGRGQIRGRRKGVRVRVRRGRGGFLMGPYKRGRNEFVGSGFPGHGPGWRGVISALFLTATSKNLRAIQRFVRGTNRYLLCLKKSAGF